MNRSFIFGWLYWCVAFAFLIGFTACGGKTGTLTVGIVVSPGDDPFNDAASVRFTVGDSSHVSSAPVSMGKFSYKLSLKPLASPGPIIVEALDSMGNVIARGITPSLPVQAVDAQVAVWVGRVGRVQPAAAQLVVPVQVKDAQGNVTVRNDPSPRSELAAVNVPGLGVVFAGGRDSDGNALVKSAVYDIYTHDVIATADMSKARAGAAMAPAAGDKAAVFGGASSAGAGTFGAPDGTIDLFDPTVGVGVWAALPEDAFAARSLANGTLMLSGSTLISGGADGNGTPLGSAAVVNPDGAVRLTALASAMAAPRLGHAVAPAKFPDGDGAILFGGLAAGTSGPVAERLVGQSFSGYDLGAVDNRVHATATLMPSGDVLVLGGTTADGVQASGLVITPGLMPPTVTPLANALSLPRDGHTATLTGNELVVCGGVDGTGAAIKSCDILDAKTYGVTRTVPLATARTGHVAAKLDTGVVLLAGGLGPDGKPLASIELYTPPP
jgi:hypothetical protein